MAFFTFPNLCKRQENQGEKPQQEYMLFGRVQSITAPIQMLLQIWVSIPRILNNGHGGEGIQGTEELKTEELKMSQGHLRWNRQTQISDVIYKVR